jgi:hypothetical protein
MHTALLVPDGVGVRNFVLGSFLEELRRQGRVTILHALPAEVAQRPELRAVPGVEWRQLPVYKEDLLTYQVRRALLFSHLYWGNTVGMRYVLQQSIPNGSLKERVGRYAAMLAGRLAATQAGIQLLDQQHEARVLSSSAAREAQRMLAELRPDVVFCSHQRPHVVAPFVAAARAAGIPTATFIFSWDNLLSKGRIASRFDYFLVWSELMRSELLRFYPDVSEERVHVVGTPQFDPYADQALLWSREQFCDRIGADPSRPIICYSGGDSDCSPDDPAYVELLAGLIESGEIAGNPQLLVRPAPVDNGHRYRRVRERFPSILVSQPAWYHPEGERWSWVVPSLEDIQLLANTIYHSAANVNLASTMSLDFAILDRPVVNIAIDVVDPPRWGKTVREFNYRFDHYLPVIELGAVRLAQTPADLRDHLNAYLRDPSLDRAGRRALVELEVSLPIGSASRRSVETLCRIAAPLPAGQTH